ncbi:MAG: outer membrane protein assembly factor BamE [Caulobacteraceae bacterium]|nr:outer membrane protein assembly factor BamE [Caulobacteraceae bacterium]
MSRRLAFVAVLSFAALGAAGCMPIASNQGFQIVDVSPSDIQAGADTRGSVTSKLGTPSATSTMDGNTWYYVTQTTSRIAFYKPRVINRTVVAIAFAPGDQTDDQKVASIQKYGIESGRVFAFNSRTTPTRGRELSVVEQLLGNLGQSAPFLNQDNQGIPGTRPGD